MSGFNHEPTYVNQWLRLYKVYYIISYIHGNNNKNLNLELKKKEKKYPPETEDLLFMVEEISAQNNTKETKVHVKKTLNP